MHTHITQNQSENETKQKQGTEAHYYSIHTHTIQNKTIYDLVNTHIYFTNQFLFVHLKTKQNSKNPNTILYDKIGSVRNGMLWLSQFLYFTSMNLEFSAPDYLFSEESKSTKKVFFSIAATEVLIELHMNWFVSLYFLFENK